MVGAQPTKRMSLNIFDILKFKCIVAYFCPLHASYFSTDYVNMQDTYANLQDKYANMQVRKRIGIIQLLCYKCISWYNIY